MSKKGKNLATNNGEVASTKMFKDTELPIGLSYSHMTQELREIYKSFSQRDRDRYNRETRKFRQKTSDELYQLVFDTNTQVNDVQTAVNKNQDVVIERLNNIDGRLSKIENQSPTEVSSDEILASVDEKIGHLNASISSLARKNANALARLENEAKKSRKDDKSFKQKMKEKWESFYDKVQTVATYFPLMWLLGITIVRLLEDAFSAVKGFFVGIADRISSAISNTVNNVKTFITNKIQNVSNFVTETIKPLKEFFGIGDGAEEKAPESVRYVLEDGATGTKMRIDKGKVSDRTKRRYEEAKRIAESTSVLQIEHYNKPNVSTSDVTGSYKQSLNAKIMETEARMADKTRTSTSSTYENEGASEPTTTPYAPMPPQSPVESVPIINNNYNTSITQVSVSQRETPIPFH